MSVFTQSSARYCTRVCIGLSLVAMFLITPLASAGYIQRNLVTDDQQNLAISGYAPADKVDPNLINPWGISSSSASPFWVSDNGTGLSTLYNGAGNPQALVVTVPGGNPTGQVFNGHTTSFAGDRFLFATEAGTIAGWQGGTNAVTRVDNSGAGAIYKGLGIDTSSIPGGDLLYAANFGSGNIDTFDQNFAPKLGGFFTDPNLPAGYAPFNIQNLGGELFVTYAFKVPGSTDETAGTGLGVVDVFDTQGNLLRRLVNAGGELDAPWGLALAPGNFGKFSNDLLVGNFGDGKINAFDPLTGIFKGTLSDINGNPIVIDGLWGLSFGNGGNGGRTDTLYFAAGINDEKHGLFGSLSSEVPEPPTLPMIVLGLILAYSCRHRSAK